MIRNRGTGAYYRIGRNQSQRLSHMEAASAAGAAAVPRDYPQYKPDSREMLMRYLPS